MTPVLSLAVAFGMTVPLAGSAAQNVAIQHDAVSCVVAGEFPQFEVDLEPSASVARSRLHFRPRGGERWYSVPLEPEGDSFTAVISKSKPTLEAIDYYVSVTASDLTTNRTEDFSARVVAGMGA